MTGDSDPHLNPTPATRRTHAWGGLFPTLIIAMGLLCGAASGFGQEALRMSLAGDFAAEARRQAASTLGYYNLLLGPTAWRFSSGLALDYDDNVRLQERNASGDFIFRPNLSTGMHWPVTQKNSLDAALSAGYSAYVSHSDLSRFYVNPGSGLSFDLYAGDCVINLHDRISITENTYQNPTVGNNGDFAQLENTAGLDTFWDMNKLVAKLGYDHANDISLGSGRQVPDASLENWYANAGARLLPEFTAGVEAGAGLISYDRGQTAEPDATQWNAGGFCQAQISKYLRGRLDAGYTVYAPDTGGAFTNLNQATGLYFQLSLSHRLNQFVSYVLSAGRSTDSSFYGQPYNYYFVRLQPAWHILRKISLSTPFWWESGTQLYALGGQGADFEQFGAGLSLRRALTQKLSGGVSYQFVQENSAEPSLNYTVNIVSLSFSYQF